MGIAKHNQTDLITERRLSSRADSFSSAMDSQNKNQAQNQRLARLSPALQKQDLNPQPGQKNRSTPVAIAHRFDHWGRTPVGNKTARDWQKLYRFASSKGEKSIETANTQNPNFYVTAGELGPERKNNFQKYLGGK